MRIIIISKQMRMLIINDSDGGDDGDDKFRQRS